MQQATTRPRPIKTAGVDWAASWKHKVEVRAAHPVGARNWDERAGRFARMTAELNTSREPLLRALSETVRPDDSALDVGAGAGRYALPLASMASRVTAVEPSAGMRASLERTLQERGVSNVTVVPGTWQEVNVEPHDVVLCAHVLYFVPDAVPFIEKLDAAARRTCYIYLRVDERETLFHPLWEELFDDEFPSEPGFADLYPLLLSLGIRANVAISGGDGGGYLSIDEAVDQAKPLFGIAPDDDQYDARMRSHFKAHLVPRGDRLTLPGSLQTAVVWWEKG